MPTTLEQIQYGFDRDSRRTWQKRPLSTTQDQAYQYDALSQVNAASRGSLNLNATAISGTPSLAENWNYDPTGNWRDYHTAANGTATLDQQRVHDRGNRLTQIEDNPHNMILDRAGRMRQLAPDAEGDWNGRLELTWDAWSRITKVQNNDEVVGEYSYDGSHRRITREVDEEILHSYYNDAWHPVEERKGSGTTASMSYLWGSRHRDDLVRRDRAVGGATLNETRYVLMDYFNPSVITDEEGDVTERYAFSAFGVRTILNPDYSVRSGSECAMEFAFQGQFVDTENGLMNYGYRYYAPYLGRWTCKDPIRESGGYNIYAIVSNRALNQVDYFGLSDNPLNSRITKGLNTTTNKEPGFDVIITRNASKGKGYLIVQVTMVTTTYYLEGGQTSSESQAGEGQPTGTIRPPITDYKLDETPPTGGTQDDIFRSTFPSEINGKKVCKIMQTNKVKVGRIPINSGNDRNGDGRVTQKDLVSNESITPEKAQELMESMTNDVEEVWEYFWSSDPDGKESLTGP